MSCGVALCLRGLSIRRRRPRTTCALRRCQSGGRFRFGAWSRGDAGNEGGGLRLRTFCESPWGFEPVFALGCGCPRVHPSRCVQDIVSSRSSSLRVVASQSLNLLFSRSGLNLGIHSVDQRLDCSSVHRLASFESSFRAASDMVSIARASLNNAVAAAESPLSRLK
jgi:hypothetical protein